MEPLFTPCATALRERYADIDDAQMALLADSFHDIARIRMYAARDLGRDTGRPSGRGPPNVSYSCDCYRRSEIDDQR